MTLYFTILEDRVSPAHCRHLLWTKEGPTPPEDASVVVLFFAIPRGRDLTNSFLHPFVTPAPVVSPAPGQDDPALGQEDNEILGTSIIRSGNTGARRSTICSTVRRWIPLETLSSALPSTEPPSAARCQRKSLLHSFLRGQPHGLKGQGLFQARRRHGARDSIQHLVKWGFHLSSSREAYVNYLGALMCANVYRVSGEQNSRRFQHPRSLGALKAVFTTLPVSIVSPVARSSETVTPTHNRRSERMLRYHAQTRDEKRQ